MTGSLTAAHAARRDAALDKLWRDPESGQIYTHRQRIDTGEYAYRVRSLDLATGRSEFAFITHAEALEAIADEGRYGPGSLYAEYGTPRALALHHATQVVGSKFAFDYADTLPILNETHNAGRRVSYVLGGGAES